MVGYGTMIVDESATIGITAPAPAPAVPQSPYRSFSQNPQMSISTAEALKQVYSRYVGALQGASDFLRDDLPSASPGIAKWAQETGRRACRKYARQRGSVPFLTSDPSWDGICSGYWGAINEGPTSGGSYGPLYPGGQCAVAYRWTTRSRRYNPNTGELIQEDVGTDGDYLGPLSWSNLPDIVVFGRTESRLQVTYNGGSNIYTTKVIDEYGKLRSTYGIENIRRVDGQADNCGDQDSEYRPPTFPPNLPPLPTTPTNPAPGFGNNWDVNILPDGQVSICIGGECSTGTPPGGGGGPDSGGGPGEPDGPPQENDPNDPNDPNEITGCVEDGKILTGLRIELTDIPSGSKVTDGNYYGVCWVYMGPDSEKLDMISDGRWVYDGQFFLPDSDSCTCYKVKVRYPWGIRVQAFSRPKEE